MKSLVKSEALSARDGATHATSLFQTDGREVCTAHTPLTRTWCCDGVGCLDELLFVILEGHGNLRRSPASEL